MCRVFPIKWRRSAQSHFPLRCSVSVWRPFGGGEGCFRRRRAILSLVSLLVQEGFASQLECLWVREFYVLKRLRYLFCLRYSEVLAGFTRPDRVSSPDGVSHRSPAGNARHQAVVIAVVALDIPYSRLFSFGWSRQDDVGKLFERKVKRDRKRPHHHSFTVHLRIKISKNCRSDAPWRSKMICTTHTVTSGFHGRHHQQRYRAGL